mmetsp:Transcript_61027/g.189039  ORF Transcript_61027/g.189039 Transcript_61027/m.189039 type:complete len:330 (-) Transcript_61027:189-1178(-)
MMRLPPLDVALLAIFSFSSARALRGLKDPNAKEDAEFHFLADNRMACYEGTNDTTMKETLLLYRDTPWAEFFETSEVRPGSCFGDSYLISTTNPEECATTNASLHVFLDLDASHNIDWAQAERLAVLKAVDGDPAQATLMLTDLARRTCTKPQFMHLIEKAEKSADEPHKVEWTVGKTAVMQSRGLKDKQAEADAATVEAMRAKEQAEELAQRAAEARARAEEADTRARARRIEAERERAERLKEEEEAAKRKTLSYSAKVTASQEAGANATNATGSPNVKDQVDEIQKALEQIAKQVASIQAASSSVPSSDSSERSAAPRKSFLRAAP